MDTMANTLYYPLYTTHKKLSLLPSHALFLSLAYWLLATLMLPNFDLCRALDINDMI